MTTFFTADHHFGHAKVIEYTKRPFSTVEDMDNAMINIWNFVVRPADEVYHLGDFTLGNLEKFWSYRNRLNGKIYLITGGHDYNWYKKFLSSSNTMVLPQLHRIKMQGKEIVLCHYPLLTWEKSHYGSLHLHGHCHGKIGIVGRAGNINLPPRQENGFRVDVGIDCWYYTPVTLEQILKKVSMETSLI